MTIVEHFGGRKSGKGGRGPDRTREGFSTRGDGRLRSKGMGVEAKSEPRRFAEEGEHRGGPAGLKRMPAKLRKTAMKGNSS